MNVVRCKHGVRFDRIAPAGFRILAAIERTARRLKTDITITSACDNHPLESVHGLGEAFDLRTRDWTDEYKLAVLRELLLELQDDDHPNDAPLPVSGGLATRGFWGWIEHPHETNEHLHIQRRRGTVYPVQEGKRA